MQVLVNSELTRIIDKFLKTKNISVEELRFGDEVVVVTRNHVYIFTMLDSRGNAIARSNNVKYITEKPTEIHIIGSTFTGASIYLDQILLGSYLELTIKGDKKPVRLTRARRIARYRKSLFLKTL